MSKSATSEVFISYARSTESEAGRIASALRDQGYGVWWDDDLPGNRAFAEVIEERVREAKAVLVVWSADAAKFQWVRAEADIARHAGSLVQVSVDGTIPPIPFNQLQCSNLRDWCGDLDDDGWRKVGRNVSALVGRSAKGPHRGTACHTICQGGDLCSAVRKHERRPRAGIFQ